MGNAREILEDTITLLAAQVPRRLTRTGLVKLLYLVDLRSWERRGRSLTKVQWIWHNYGPYSAEITETVGDLEGNDELQVEAVRNAQGSIVYRIRSGPKASLYGILTDEDKLLIDSVLKEFGTYTPTTLTTLTYQTPPIENAQTRFEPLDFSLYASNDSRPDAFVPDATKPPSPKMDQSWTPTDLSSVDQRAPHPVPSH
jgi:uncharacterized protein YwgA